MCRRRSPLAFFLLLLAVAGPASSGCARRGDLPPPPENEPKKDEGPSCGKVFKDPKVRGGSGCCYEPAAGLLKGADIAAACGANAAAYVGETRDGAACRLHFQLPGGEPKDTFVMVSRPVIPPGVPVPVRPDPLLAWDWKKVTLRDAIGYRAAAASREPGLLESQHVLWAGRGRRIVGLHVAKRLCDESQAQALLQKAIDAVP
jgi:hypothetical protein